ncbi:hypothetical protein, partial [Arcobacter cloacae]|uniref:hypothetical protein n=1 Tax=Arcobacter cloacae TaxID=1054034 RepID=UPI0039EE9F9E
FLFELLLVLFGGSFFFSPFFTLLSEILVPLFSYSFLPSSRVLLLWFVFYYGKKPFYRYLNRKFFSLFNLLEDLIRDLEGFIKPSYFHYIIFTLLFILIVPSLYSHALLVV